MYFTKDNEILSRSSLKMNHNVGGMASKGLRVIPYQDTRKVEAGHNPSQTTETLIGYPACCS